MNTPSEIEEYYKAREQQLLEKLHQQETALAAAEQTLKQLTEDQKTLMDETTEQCAARERSIQPASAAMPDGYPSCLKEELQQHN